VAFAAAARGRLPKVGNSVWALYDTTFKIAPGEIVGLANKNGQKGMVVQLGFFTREFPFPNRVAPPAPRRCSKAQLIDVFL
jgi:hypothetical protein